MRRIDPRALRLLSLLGGELPAPDVLDAAALAQRFGTEPSVVRGWIRDLRERSGDGGNMGNEVAVTLLSTDELVADESTQWRQSNTQEAIDDMAEHLRAGGTLPPIDVFDDGQVKRVADGHHRLAAHRASSTPQIAARVHRGDADAAFLFGVRSRRGNRSVRVTRNDDRHTALQLMKRPGLAMGDREIARELGLSHQTIGRWRAEWVASGPLDQMPTERGVTRNGAAYTIDTSKIGKRPEPKAEEPAHAGEVVAAPARPAAPAPPPRAAVVDVPASAVEFVEADDGVDPGEVDPEDVERIDASACEPPPPPEKPLPIARDLNEMQASSRLIAACDEFRARIVSLLGEGTVRAMREPYRAGVEGAFVRVISELSEQVDFQDGTSAPRWKPRIVHGG